MSAGANVATPARVVRWSWRMLRVCTAVFALVWLIAYWAAFEPLIEEFDAGEQKLQKLMNDYVVKAEKAGNLDSRRTQLRAIQQAKSAAENLVPSGFDGQIVELLQAARAQGVRIDELQMGTDVLVREVSIETTGKLRVSGPFHDLGAFVAQLASHDTPFVLQDLRIESAPGGEVVSMDATVRALRYLDDAELAAIRVTARIKKK